MELILRSIKQYQKYIIIHQPGKYYRQFQYQFSHVPRNFHHESKYIQKFSPNRQSPFELLDKFQLIRSIKDENKQLRSLSAPES